MGNFRAGNQSRRVIARQTQIIDEAVTHLPRQFRQLGFYLGNPVSRNNQRQQIGIGEVAVIVGIFLGPHNPGFTPVRIKQHGRLLNLATFFDFIDLPLHLKINRLLQETEGVEVLDFTTRTQLNLAFWPDRHIGIAAE